MVFQQAMLDGHLRSIMAHVSLKLSEATILKAASSKELTVRMAEKKKPGWRGENIAMHRGFQNNLGKPRLKYDISWEDRISQGHHGI